MVAVVQPRPAATGRPVRVTSSPMTSSPVSVRPLPAPAVPPLTYRRRRAAAAGILVALVMAVQGLLTVVGGGSSPSAPPPIPAEARAGYVVQPGDTFWSIAVRLRPGRDPRPLVDRLVADHGRATLVVGERIALPERG